MNILTSMFRRWLLFILNWKISLLIRFIEFFLKLSFCHPLNLLNIVVMSFGKFGHDCSTLFVREIHENTLICYLRQISIEPCFRLIRGS